MASSGLDEEKLISKLDAAADMYIDRCQDASFGSTKFLVP